MITTSLSSPLPSPSDVRAESTRPVSTALRRTDLRGDCGRCFALCCTAFGFARSVDFAEDKPAGTPCRHLDSMFACSIHDALPTRGFRGCTVFDCFGAGQAVSQRLFSGVSWREHPETRDRMFSAFRIFKQMHEMLWYLDEARDRTYDLDLEDEIDALVARITSSLNVPLDEVLAIETDTLHAAVRQVLISVSAQVRESYFADGGFVDRRLAPGADLAGEDLRGHRLCGADLRGAVLIGVDLRGCDLAGVDLLGADLRDARLEDADLARALYLTRPQLYSAHGNARTRVPDALSVPESWRRDGR